MADGAETALVARGLRASAGVVVGTQWPAMALVARACGARLGWSLGDPVAGWRW